MSCRSLAYSRGFNIYAIQNGGEVCGSNFCFLNEIYFDFSFFFFSFVSSVMLARVANIGSVAQPTLTARSR